MGSFFRVDTSKLMRGAGRILYAPSAQAKPTKISDVIVLASGLTQYDTQTGWADLGATREGIQVSVNNTETSFDIDQVQGVVGTQPDSWTCTVTTRLAETTLEHFVFAWEGVPITTEAAAATPAPTLPLSERETAFAGATAYTERRLAVLFKKPSGLLMGYFFHRAVRAPQEGVIDFQKAGDAMSLQVQFNILADATETDPRAAFFRVREQIPTP
jgi:hypothetical protein